MPCDPDTEYEVRNIGYLSDTATAQTPASVATTVQAPAAGGLATGEAPMRTNADAVVLSTPEPLYGGELHVRLSVVATASVSTQYAFRLTTEGLRSLSVLTHALGTDTLTNHYLALSDADAPGTYDGNWNFLVTGGAMGSGANLIINLGDTGLPIIQSQGADYKTTPPRERAMYLVTTTHVAGVSLRVDVHGTAGL